MANIPHDIPGKVIHSWGQVDAAENWVDVFYLTDAGEVWHSWYRGKAGWQGPEKIGG